MNLHHDGHNLLLWVTTPCQSNAVHTASGLVIEGIQVTEAIEGVPAGISPANPSTTLLYNHEGHYETTQFCCAKRALTNHACMQKCHTLTLSFTTLFCQHRVQTQISKFKDTELEGHGISKGSMWIK